MRHEVGSLVVFRERDDLADAVLAGDKHRDAVEAESKAAVGRCTEAEGIEDVRELDLLLLRRDAEHPEHLRLEILFMDPDRSAAELVAVQHHVISDGTNIRVIALFQQPDIIRMRAGERMVDGNPMAALLIVCEQREIDDPEEIEFVRVVVELLHHRAFRAHAAEDGGNAFAGTGGEEHNISLLKVHFRGHVRLLLLGENFPQRALVFAAFELDEREVFHRQARLNGDLVEPVHLACGDAREALRVDRTDDTRAVEDAAENLELGRAEHVGEIGDFHIEARVRLVGAVDIHRLAVGHARELRRDVDAEAGFEHRTEQTLHEFNDVLLADEARLDVDLRELRLSVGAQVLVAEAAGDLVVSFQTSHHHQLLVLLRRLRQGVKFPGVEAGGHEKIARTFGGRVRKDGRLDLEEAGLI